MSNTENQLVVGAPGDVDVLEAEIVSAEVKTVVLAELPEKEQEAQLVSVSAAICQLDREIDVRSYRIGEILFNGVYGGDVSKLGNHGNRGDSIRAVAQKCSEGGTTAVAGSATALRRFLNSYLGVGELGLEPTVAAPLGALRLDAVHRLTDSTQKAEIVKLVSAGDIKGAKTVVDTARKAAAKTSAPPVAHSGKGPSDDAPRDEAAEQLAAQERREEAQKAAKLLLNQAFAAAVAAGLARVLVEKMLSDAFGDDEEPLPER